MMLRRLVLADTGPPYATLDRSDQDISLFDAITHVVSERLHVPVWSYDHHFDVLRTRRWR
jgi:predicted nucleic acid-binding protein